MQVIEQRQPISLKNLVGCDTIISRKPLCAKIDGIESNPLPGDIKKKSHSNSLDDAIDDDNKKDQKASIDTDYIIQGDGQFKIHIVSPAKRDKERAKEARNAKKKFRLPVS